MTQIDMFSEVVVKGKRVIEVSEELTAFQESTLQIDYADKYITSKGFGKLIGNVWVYSRDEYKLLHYLARFGLGQKQSIAGWELSEIMFNNRNTEKLRGMINLLRNDIQNELIIGSSQNGYFIARQNEIYDAVKYIFAKSVNEMITAINMFPPLKERYIKIASRTYQDNERVFDSQMVAQFDELTNDLMVIRYADTMKYEGKK